MSIKEKKCIFQIDILLEIRNINLSVLKENFKLVPEDGRLLKGGLSHLYQSS